MIIMYIRHINGQTDDMKVALIYVSILIHALHHKLHAIFNLNVKLGKNRYLLAFQYECYLL